MHKSDGVDRVQGNYKCYGRDFHGGSGRKPRDATPRDQQLSNIWEVVSTLANALTDARDRLVGLMAPNQGGYASQNHVQKGQNNVCSPPRRVSPPRYYSPPTPRVGSLSPGRRVSPGRGYNSQLQPIVGRKITPSRYPPAWTTPIKRPPYSPTAGAAVQNLHRDHVHGHVAFGLSSEYRFRAATVGVTPRRDRPRNARPPFNRCPRHECGHSFYPPPTSRTAIPASQRGYSSPGPFRVSISPRRSNEPPVECKSPTLRIVTSPMLRDRGGCSSNGAGRCCLHSGSAADQAGRSASAEKCGAPSQIPALPSTTAAAGDRRSPDDHPPGSRDGSPSKSPEDPKRHCIGTQYAALLRQEAQQLRQRRLAEERSGRLRPKWQRY